MTMQSLLCSNNTNKLSPQERRNRREFSPNGSNNTNKLSPQEHLLSLFHQVQVQIIQINLVLKNGINLSICRNTFK